MAVWYRRIALLALAAVAIGAPEAFADSINLLRPATKGLSPSILIDTSRRPMDGDEQAAAQLDEDCVALHDRVRDTSSRFGSVRWDFGRLSWDWAPASEPSMVYVICLDPRRASAPLGGTGMQLMAALSWSRAQHAGRVSEPRVAGAERPIVANHSIANPEREQDERPGGEPALPPAPFGGSDPPSVALDDIAPFSSIATLTAGEAVGEGGSGNDAPPVARFDPPITLDPREWADPGEMAPVPEPGTWLLMGTGLAAAWKAARRRK